MRHSKVAEVNDATLFYLLFNFFLFSHLFFCINFYSFYFYCYFILFSIIFFPYSPLFILSLLQFFSFLSFYLLLKIDLLYPFIEMLLLLQSLLAHHISNCFSPAQSPHSLLLSFSLLVNFFILHFALLFCSFLLPIVQFHSIN